VTPSHTHTHTHRKESKPNHETFEKAKVGIAYHSENDAVNILNMTKGTGNKSKFKTVESTN